MCDRDVLQLSRSVHVSLEIVGDLGMNLPLDGADGTGAVRG
jgi:hypothetical protein